MDSELDQRTQNSLQHSSHHPSFSFTHSSVSQNNEHVASQECRDARLLACDADEEITGDYWNVFWVLDQRIHAINCSCM